LAKQRFSDHFLDDADPQSLMNYVRKLRLLVQQQGQSFVNINIFLKPFFVFNQPIQGVWVKPCYMGIMNINKVAKSKIVTVYKPTKIVISIYLIFVSYECHLRQFFISWFVIFII